MPRLMAIEGPESGVALPILGRETYLSPGASGRVRLSRAGERPANGVVVRGQGDGYRIERIGSTGGTSAPPLFVNGEEMEAALLHHGDLITYGGTTLIFDCEDVEGVDTVAVEGGKPLALDARGAPRSGRARAQPAGGGANEAERSRTPQLPEEEAGRESGPVPALLDDPRLGSGESVTFRQRAYEDPDAAIRRFGKERERDRSPADHLAVLLKVSMAVGATLDLSTLLARLLDLIFEEVPADRGTILLFDRPAKKLRSIVSKRRAAGAGGGEAPVRVSRTIVKEALTSRDSILSVDAMTDERFRSGDSVAAAGIRSVMCVPIVRSGRVLGVIHLDTERPEPGAFGRAHLDLMSGIASVVSLAIENARFYQEAAERERLRTELSLASSIQQRLLPKSQPRAPDLDVFGRMVPAKELGGDIFDFIEDEARSTLHVLVGDVSGKGVGAGIIMAMARSYLRPLAAAFDSPREALIRANRLLYGDTTRDLFVSAVLLRWDGAAKRLLYCGAGQENLLIVRAGSERCEAIPAGGVALLMMEDLAPFLDDRELALSPGDLVVLYTDGVTDARSSTGQFFGLDRLTAALPAIARSGGAREVVERIVAEVQGFAGDADQHDDFTVVALARRA